MKLLHFSLLKEQNTILFDLVFLISALVTSNIISVIQED